MCTILLCRVAEGRICASTGLDVCPAGQIAVADLELLAITVVLAAVASGRLARAGDRVAERRRIAGRVVVPLALRRVADVELDPIARKLVELANDSGPI